MQHASSNRQIIRSRCVFEAISGGIENYPAATRAFTNTHFGRPSSRIVLSITPSLTYTITHKSNNNQFEEILKRRGSVGVC